MGFGDDTWDEFVRIDERVICEFGLAGGDWAKVDWDEVAGGFGSY